MTTQSEERGMPVFRSERGSPGGAGRVQDTIAALAAAAIVAAAGIVAVLLHVPGPRTGSGARVRLLLKCLPGTSDPGSPIELFLVRGTYLADSRVDPAECRSRLILSNPESGN